MTMIEKIARAMHSRAGIMLPYECLNDVHKRVLIGYAKAALEAMKEPNEEMIKACPGYSDDVIDNYKVMIEAALKQDDVSSK